MSARPLLNGLNAVISAGCLAAGCALAGQWLMLPLVLIALAGWISVWKWPRAGLSPVALLISVSLAGAGLLAGAPPALMIVSAAFSLASWDLTSFDRTLPAAANIDYQFETRHIQSLGLALALGLLIALAGRMLLFRIPFGVMLVLVVAALLTFDRIWRLLSD